MYKKLLLILSIMACVNVQTFATIDDQPEAQASRGAIASESSPELIASLVALCPNPDCSQKLDALPKTKKVPGGIYHCGYSYRAHCPVCGDERDILFFDEE